MNALSFVPNVLSLNVPFLSLHREYLSLHGHYILIIGPGLTLSIVNLDYGKAKVEGGYQKWPWLEEKALCTSPKAKSLS